MARIQMHNSCKPIHWDGRGTITRLGEKTIARLSIRRQFMTQDFHSHLRSSPVGGLVDDSRSRPGPSFRVNDTRPSSIFTSRDSRTDICFARDPFGLGTGAGTTSETTAAGGNKPSSAAVQRWRKRCCPVCRRSVRNRSDGPLGIDAGRCWFCHENDRA